MLQCINVKLKFAIELQAVDLRCTTYLRTPLFGMILVVTLFVKGTGAVAVQLINTPSALQEADEMLPKINAFKQYDIRKKELVLLSL